MAAVVASHHMGLWQDRREPSTHFSNMNLTNLMPTYDISRTVSNAPTPRSFLPTTTQHMDMSSIPLFAPNGLPTSIPFQPATYAFEPIQVNAYNIPQNTYYPHDISQPIPYTGAPDVQTLSTVRDTNTTFIAESNPMVKSESASPIQPTQVFDTASYSVECKRSLSEPSEASGINFATDVDTLMKAIQAKQTSPAPPPPVHKVVFTTPSVDSYAKHQIGGGSQAEPKA